MKGLYQSLLFVDLWTWRRGSTHLDSEVSRGMNEKNLLSGAVLEKSFCLGHWGCICVVTDMKRCRWAS